MGPLATQLLAAMPRLSTTGRDIIGLLADSGGRIDSADSFATQFCLRSRHQLARTLRREGLPQIEELHAWIKVLHLLLEWEITHRSLLTLAHNEALYAPNCYRLIKRVTGKTWRAACAEGFSIMLVTFVSRYQGVRHGGKGGAQETVGQIA